MDPCTTTLLAGSATQAQMVSFLISESMAQLIAGTFFTSTGVGFLAWQNVAAAAVAVQGGLAIGIALVILYWMPFIGEYVVSGVQTVVTSAPFSWATSIVLFTVNNTIMVVPRIYVYLTSTDLWFVPLPGWGWFSANPHTCSVDPATRAWNCSYVYNATYNHTYNGTFDNDSSWNGSAGSSSGQPPGPPDGGGWWWSVLRPFYQVIATLVTIASTWLGPMAGFVLDVFFRVVLVLVFLYFLLSALRTPLGWVWGQIRDIARFLNSLGAYKSLRSQLGGTPFTPSQTQMPVLLETLVNVVNLYVTFFRTVFQVVGGLVIAVKDLLVGVFSSAHTGYRAYKTREEQRRSVTVQEERTKNGLDLPVTREQQSFVDATRKQAAAHQPDDDFSAGRISQLQEVLHADSSTEEYPTVLRLKISLARPRGDESKLFNIGISRTHLQLDEASGIKLVFVSTAGRKQTFSEAVVLSDWEFAMLNVYRLPSNFAKNPERVFDGADDLIEIEPTLIPSQRTGLGGSPPPPEATVLSTIVSAPAAFSAAVGNTIGDAITACAVGFAEGLFPDQKTGSATTGAATPAPAPTPDTTPAPTPASPPVVAQIPPTTATAPPAPAAQQLGGAASPPTIVPSLKCHVCGETGHFKAACPWRPQQLAADAAATAVLLKTLTSQVATLTAALAQPAPPAPAPVATKKPTAARGAPQ